MLLVTGLLVGPVFGWLNPEPLFRDWLHPLISIAVGIILFEGGLSLNVSELRKIGPLVLRLCTVGVAVTWVLATGLCFYLIELPWTLSILFGAILTVTGPTVVGPLLNHVRPQGRVGSIAKWEGIVADVIGASLAVLVFHTIAHGAQPGESAITMTLVGLLKTATVGTLAGLLGAFALGLPLRRYWVPDSLHIPLTLGILLAVFVGSDHIQHESGLLAVTLMGFLLANQKGTSIHHIIEFKENLRTLLIAGLFVVLAASVELDALLALGWREYSFVALLILVVRPASVQLSMLGSDAVKAERTFLSFLAPRGVVAAAISALFAAQLADPIAMGAAVIPEARALVPLSFLVIVGTVAFYGLSASPIARRLGLAKANPQGCLIIGGSPFALALCKSLTELGFDIVMMDTNRESVATARLGGIVAISGSAIAADAEERLPLGGIGRILALTPNDEVNLLAGLHFRELFGRAETYQLPPSGISAKHETSGKFHGRYLFDESARFTELERRISDGARITATALTEEFTYEHYLDHNQAGVLPLFRINKEGQLSIFSLESPPSAQAGDRVISLVSSQPEPEPSS
ncbi:MAG: cation:proton antiporter [Planctomycetes bacterium]|nr:cation:proton antiporter [Planctomycetota bacterium]